MSPSSHLSTLQAPPSPLHHQLGFQVVATTRHTSSSLHGLPPFNPTFLARKTHPKDALVTTLQPWSLLQATNLAIKGFKPYKSLNTHSFKHTSNLHHTHKWSSKLDQERSNKEELSKFEAKNQEKEAFEVVIEQPMAQSGIGLEDV
ncbi:hypothetical protein Tco_1060463 [Tanacetum coccineum]